MNFKLCCLSAFLLFCLARAYSKPVNYYIEIDKPWIEIGKYSTKFKKIPLQKYHLDRVNLEEAVQLVLSDTSERILYYFHSMWGSQQIYHKNSLKKLNTLKGLDKIVSIIWHTDKLSYIGSWKLAIHQGDQLAPLFNQLAGKELNHNYVLCHSMGNRIFEGLIKELKYSKVRFKAVFFAASDLEVDVFSNNLSILLSISQRNVVYVHQKDRMLKAAKIAHGKDRLGLNAWSYKSDFEDFNNIELVNITNSKYAGKISMSNHIYFKNHKTVLRDMEYVINSLDAKRAEHINRREGPVIELK